MKSEKGIPQQTIEELLAQVKTDLEGVPKEKLIEQGRELLTAAIAIGAVAAMMENKPALVAGQALFKAGTLALRAALGAGASPENIGGLVVEGLPFTPPVEILSWVLDFYSDGKIKAEFQVVDMSSAYRGQREHTV